MLKFGGIIGTRREEKVDFQGGEADGEAGPAHDLAVHYHGDLPGGGKGEGLAVPVGDKLGVLPVEPLGVLAHQAEENDRLSRFTEKLRDTLLAIPGAAENGGKEPRVPGFLSLRFKGVRGPDLASMLDLQGITIGTGSACEAAAGRPSPILRTLGLSEREAAESVRLSLGYRTTESDIDRLCQGIPATVSKLRALSCSSLR